MIFVFSGTNNSKYAAEAIASVTGDSIYSINEALKAGTMPDHASDENLVIVCPTYAWRIPLVVENFIKQNHFNGAKRIWFVMTCGGDIGNAGKYNEALSKKLGLEYMGTAEIQMPDNYIIMFKAISQESAEEIFSKAHSKLNTAANQIKEGRPFLIRRANPVGKIESSYVNTFFNKTLKSDLYVANDKCINCGKCEKLCPLNNIKLVAGKPVWGGHCTHCMGCISYCPTEAIEYGEKTVGKRRYTFESYLGK